MATDVTYIGNPDFRGFLAANDPQYLGLVGNSPTSGNSFGINNGINGAALGSFLTSQGVNSEVPGQNPGQSTIDAINQLYNTYNAAANSGLLTPSDGSGGGDGSSGSTGGGSSSSSYANPAAASLYGNLANEYTNEANTLEGEIPTLEQNIANAYNTSVGEENQNTATANNQNMQERQTTRGTIDQNANSTYNGLEQLLASRGAAGSSAAEFNVPQAVGTNTDTASNTMNTTFNENDQNITQANQNALANLLSQENTNMASGIGGIETQRAQDVQQAQGDEANVAYYGGQPNATLNNNLNTDASNIQSQLSDIFAKYATPTYIVPATPGLATYAQPTAPTITTPSTSTPTSASAFLPFLTQSANSNNNILTGANSTPAPQQQPVGATA